MHAHQRPLPVELFAIQDELELAVPIAGMRVAEWCPGAPVPHDDRTGAILPWWNHALEGSVVERVILYLDGHAFVGRVQAWALGYRPAFQGAVEFQAEVIVQAPGGVLLHDER